MAPENPSVVGVVAVLLRERRQVVWGVVIGLLISLAIALVLPPYYSSSFSFLPQSQQDPNRAGLASLAGQFGLSLAALGASAQPPQLYADLIVTREVLGPIVRDTFAVADAGRMPLSRFLKVRGSDSGVVYDKTLRALRRKVIQTTVATRTTGMVTVSVRTRSAQVSLDIARRLLEGLNEFNLFTRQSQARAERKFTEDRYAAARVALRAMEDSLQHHLQANRQSAPFSQSTFERDRLEREVSFRQQVVTTMAQQYEEARIREIRDTPVITVFERPALAPRPDPRGRTLIVLLGMVAGFTVSAMIVFFRDAWRDRAAQGDPAVSLLATEWKRVRGIMPF